ncbi:MAG: ribosome maturation factor RimP [Jatrophihabitantaceae bacterium]
MTARSPQRQQLEELLRPVISAEGYDLEELSVSAAGRRSLIRITVDGDDGIDLDAVAELSRAISEALDDETAAAPSFAGPYVLEVSSPGVDRPLTEHRHWRRAIGRLVEVPVTEAGGQPTLTGRVRSAEPDGLGLDVDGEQVLLAWQRVGPGRVQIEFSKPGGPAPGEPDREEEEA